MLNDQALLRRTSVAHYELHGRIHQSFIIVHTMQTGNQGSPSYRKFQETKKNIRVYVQRKTRYGNGLQHVTATSTQLGHYGDRRENNIATISNRLPYYRVRQKSSHHRILQRSYIKFLNVTR